MTKPKKAINAFDVYEIDTEAENDGIWVDLENGLEVKIAAYGNEPHSKYLRSEKKKALRANNGKAISAEKDDEIEVKAVARFILTDWKSENFVRDGVEVQYSVKEAEKLLNQTSMRRFKVAVIGHAVDQEKYLRSNLTANIKN